MMFYDARVFQQNISNWDTSSVTSFTNMFKWATTFQAKWECGINGPPSSCTTLRSDWIAPPPPSPPPSPPPNPPPPTQITDSNFASAISTCLSTNPVDGLCSSSEYGSMPDWDVSQVTNLNRAFKDKIKFNADISAWDTSQVTSMY